MSNSMNININASGVGQAVGQMRQLITGGKQLQQVLSNLPARTGGASASSNPMVRAQQASAVLQAAIQGGNPTAIFGAQLQHVRAQQSLQRALTQVNGPSFGSRLGSFISSTRFGVGGGGGLQLMPLIGQMSKLFGAGGLAGGIVMAGVTALTVFVDQVHAAADALTQIRSAAQISGGNARNMGFFGALGINAGQVPGLAGSLRGALAGGDPFAMGQAGRLGLPGIAVPTALAGTNQAGVLEMAIKRIVAENDTATKRLVAARNLDLLSIIPQIELYARHKNVIDADTAALARAANSQASQSAADFTFQLGRVQQMLGVLGQGVAGSYLGDWAKGLGNIADAARAGAKFVPTFAREIRIQIDSMFPLIGALDMVLTGIGKVGPAFKSLYTLIEQFINGIIDKLPDPIKGKMGGFKLPDWKDLADPIKDLKGAVDANTNAQNDATAAYKNGVYGGGSRARGALPGGLKGKAFSDAVAGRALQFGAFSL